MAKTKISEFSATPANNTDIDSINIAEGCAPSGINDAIRELMAQLKDFQTGAVGDSFNGPVGTSTAAAGAFTTLAASGAVTLSGGTANGVTYLNGSKVLTSGSALVFTGTNLGVGTSSPNFESGTGQGIQVNYSGGLGAHIKLTDSASGSGATDGFDLYAYNTNGYVENYEAGAIIFRNNGSEQMRLTSTGLGIGTSSPASKLQVTSANGAVTLDSGTGESHYIDITHKGSYSDLGGIRFNQGSTTYGNNQILFRAMDSGGTVQTVMTLNGAGNLGLGVTPSAWGGSIKALEGFSTSGSWSIASGGGLGSALNIQSNAYYDGSNWIYKSTSPAANYYQSAGTHVWRTAASGTAGNAISFTESARIDSSGNLLVGTTNTNPGGADVNGIALIPGGFSVISALGATPFGINRGTNDGTLINFSQAGTTEGTISVSGTTVSYNGGHLSRWAQTTTTKDESIVKGTVLSNLDAMNVYTKDGQPVDNEQLNKVKVSDTEGDVNVAGVFVNWSHDEDHNVDEINMAMTGDMIIRIAQGVTVIRGDLLMSAGDGTAKPQGDDIIRSKTVAKVTSNHVTCTYADGSYCVPCVLMAC